MNKDFSQLLIYNTYIIFTRQTVNTAINIIEIQRVSYHFSRACVIMFRSRDGIVMLSARDCDVICRTQTELARNGVDA